MAVGVVAIIVVNLIDTYWASRLGTDELAAMSFAFPVIGVVINVSLGLMIGTSVAVARVLGEGDEGNARRIAAHSLLLGVAIVTVVSGVGLEGAAVATALSRFITFVYALVSAMQMNALDIHLPTPAAVWAS